MKTFFAISAVLALASLESASAMKSYLQKLPNGDGGFTQGLGHVSDSDTGLNDFGKLYSSKNGDWAALCKEKFPGKDFTVGAALGDPCCTWKAGGTPDFKVAAFTTPTEGKVCAANAPAATTAAPAAADTKAPATTTAAPAAGATPAPAGKPATTPTVTPAPAGKPGAAAGNSTTAPAGKPDAGKPAGGKPSKCGVKKEAKSLEDDEDDDDEGVFNYED